MVRAGAAAAIALSLSLLFGAACEHGLRGPIREKPDSPSQFAWQLPAGFPVPHVPADNPMTPDKIELGRQLFHDTRLSGDGSVSCASCHRPELAYSDGRNRAVGVQGNLHPRSAMSLANVAYNATLGWDDPALIRLENQALVPLLNTQPPEMGVAGREDEVLNRFRADRRYRRLFQRAFPDDRDPVTMRNVTYALASFERTLISGNSPYDHWAYGGQVNALDSDERAGARLFFSRRLSCFRCHAGFNFSGPVVYEGFESAAPRFHNTGLYDQDGCGAYPAPNTGVHRHSGRGEDMGKFRAPTLRNIALTAPYMHDGSIPTLEDVLDHYAAGGRARSNCPQAGRLEPVPATDALISGFEIAPEQRRQLIAFLHALTDETFVRRAMQQTKQ
jgi:cytochrome c peroxidase